MLLHASSIGGPYYAPRLGVLDLCFAYFQYFYRLVLARDMNYSLVPLGFEVSTAVTMKNAVCWDIKTQFVPHRKHYISATEPSRLPLLI
jgi:hypothetical protein